MNSSWTLIEKVQYVQIFVDSYTILVDCSINIAKVWRKPNPISRFCCALPFLRHNLIIVIARQTLTNVTDSVIHISIEKGSSGSSHPPSELENKLCSKMRVRMHDTLPFRIPWFWANTSYSAASYSSRKIKKLKLVMPWKCKKYNVV